MPLKIVSEMRRRKASQRVRMMQTGQVQYRRRVSRERATERTDRNHSDERQSEGDSVSATSVNDEILRGKPSISNVRKLNPIGTY